jgi:hypothetical protein
MSEQSLNNDEMDAATGGVSFRAHHRAIPQDPVRSIPVDPVIPQEPFRVALFLVQA